MGTIRKIVGWLPYVGGLLAMIAAFDWVDYHSTKGVSPIWGRNPRCTDYQVGYCFKLDTSNMPWDATLATWIATGGWYFGIAAGFAIGVTILVGLISGAVLLGRVAVSPPQERLSRLADSRWLSLSVVSLTAVSIGSAVATLIWVQRDLIAILAMVAGNVVVFFVYFKVSGWAQRYRWERADARRALIERESANLH